MNKKVRISKQEIEKQLGHLRFADLPDFITLSGELVEDRPATEDIQGDKGGICSFQTVHRGSCGHCRNMKEPATVYEPASTPEDHGYQCLVCKHLSPNYREHLDHQLSHRPATAGEPNKYHGSCFYCKMDKWGGHENDCFIVTGRHRSQAEKGECIHRKLDCPCKHVHCCDTCYSPKELSSKDRWENVSGKELPVPEPLDHKGTTVDYFGRAKINDILAYLRHKEQ